MNFRAHLLGLAALSCGSPIAIESPRAPSEVSKVPADQSEQAARVPPDRANATGVPTDGSVAEQLSSPVVDEDLEAESSAEAPWSSGCRTGEQVANSYELTAQWMTSGPLAVVKVQVDDKLNVRASASHGAPVVGQLRYNSTGVRPTGNVCKVQGVSWYEVELEGTTGWVNGGFVAQVTTIHDFTSEYREFAPDSANSPEEFATVLVENFNRRYSDQLEGEYRSQTLGTQKLSSSRALVTVYSCCELDDSIAGKQVEIEILKEPAGWILRRVQGRYVCYRSVHGQLCS